jgi:hypothetical protein
LIQTMSLQPTDNKWSIILVVNLFLGLLLCFGILTGYSWSNDLANLIFPSVAGIVAIVTFIFARKSTIFRKQVNSFFLLPSLMIGIPSILWILSEIFLSLFLQTNMLFNSHTDGIIFQQVVSSDGTRILAVDCFSPVGHSYAVHDIRISLAYKIFPFVRQNLGHYFELSGCSSVTDFNYVRWLNNDTIYLIKEKKKIKVSFIQWNNQLAFDSEK